MIKIDLLKNHPNAIPAHLFAFDPTIPEYYERLPATPKDSAVASGWRKIGIQAYPAKLRSKSSDGQEGFGGQADEFKSYPVIVMEIGL